MRAILIAVGVNVAFFSLTYWVYAPKFQFNDDPMMMLLTAGVGRVIEPTIYLNFSHVLIGSALKALYGFALDFPWYALYLIAAMLAAHTTLLYLLLRGLSRTAALLLYSAYFFGVGINLLINLQFSISSILLASAGWVLLIPSSPLTADQERGTSKVWRILGLGAAMIFIVVGSMMRFEGMQLALALAAPMCVLRLRNRNSRGIALAMVAAASALALCIGLESANRSAYAENPDGKDFVRGNSSAGQFLDYEAERRVDDSTWSEILAEVGWSENDYQIFKQWFYMDDDVFGVENLEKMAAALPSTNRFLTLGDAMGRFGATFEDPFVRSCVTIFVLMSIFVVFDLRSASVLLLTVASIVAASFLLIYTAKPPPPRVYFGMFAYLAWTPMLIAASGRSASFASWGRVRRAGALVLLPFLIFVGVEMVRLNAEQDEYNRRAASLHRQFIADLNPQPGQIYWSWTGAFGWQFMSPFGSVSYLKDLVAPDTRLYPSTRQIMRHHEIDDMYLDLIHNANAFLAVHVGTARDKLPRLRRYMKEHYGKEVGWTLIASNLAFEVYRISELTAGS